MNGKGRKAKNQANINNSMNVFSQEELGRRIAAVEADMKSSTWKDLLFTFSAIDLIQDHFDRPLVEVIQLLKDERQMYKVAGFIIATLIQDEISRNGGRGRGPELMEVMQMLDLSMTKRVLTAILKAYGISMPEPEEDDELEIEDPEQLNIARMIYIGTTKLGYTEAEVLDMTPRKFHLIYDEYIAMNGAKIENTGGIDSLP